MNGEPASGTLSVIQGAITEGLDIAEILATMSSADRRVDPSPLQWLGEKLSGAMTRAYQAAFEMEVTE